MTAEILLAILRHRGVELVAAGDRLRFRPVDRVTTIEREAIRRYKPELLRLLTNLGSKRTPPHTLEDPQSQFFRADLDPVTVSEVLGPLPDPNELACVKFDVLTAILTLKQEIRTGTISLRLRLVRGRALAEWLDLDELARLFAEWNHWTRGLRP